MKFGEIIDYMMENEIVSTIKTNDGKIIITGKMHGPHTDIPDSKSIYMLTITHLTGAIIYKVLELSKSNWEDVNQSTESQTKPEEEYRCLSYIYEDAFGDIKTSPKEFNSIANISKWCKYKNENIIMIELH